MLLDGARRYLKHRRFRDDLFPGDLFADPAWDILIDLFVAHGEGRRVSITDACIAAAVPPTTALRWMHKLEEAGHVERRPDERDRRRFWAVLSIEAIAKVRRWLIEFTTR